MNVKQYKNYKLYIFIALLLVISLLTACDISKEISIDKPSLESQYENFEKVEVSWVVDGDTIQTIDGRTIRIIGINSPENGKYKEKYGKESTRFAIDTLKNKEVYLEQDVSNLDQYGRELRYVWINLPDEINEESLKKYNFSIMSISEGYSVPYIFEPDRKYESYIIDLATKARDEGIGLWQFGYKGTTRKTDF